MNRIQRLAAGLLLAWALVAPAAAGGLMMARSPLMFPEAMTVLQNAIHDQGYTITRLQQVNENLEKRDYASDMYRVVFFGKYEEIRALAASHPELIPFLPLNITIFAEGNNAIVLAAHPRTLGELFPDPALKPIFERWEADLAKIMATVRGQ
ncbi:uncharacterized protein (DUF302 family) [Sulfuritortus calidifontis]|uniref:Uncharacterized protein (DUF302 family) n=1 Tax=Sulfuritortus calidifontis TaxID=1914471 RepID=A0A4R3JZV9_9PROT|nr:DUF302 domain-containing protein [Sulfuritortus calidifontis]TCS72751.1 uncharacterized protein (DUF302 family) [Sulfuritortus calidifontis]